MSETPIISSSSMNGAVPLSGLRLPSGILAETLPGAELFRELTKLNVPGVDVHDGKQALLEKLSDYVATLTRVVWPTQEQAP